MVSDPDTGDDHSTPRSRTATTHEGERASLPIGVPEPVPVPAHQGRRTRAGVPEPVPEHEKSRARQFTVWPG